MELYRHLEISLIFHVLLKSKLMAVLLGKLKKERREVCFNNQWLTVNVLMWHFLIVVSYLQYMNRLMYLSHDVFTSIPPDLAGDLQRMLAVDSLSRPAAVDFTGTIYF